MINRGEGGKNEDYGYQNLCSGQSVEKLFFEGLYGVGITGSGEATEGLTTKPNLGDVKESVRFVIGEDPRHPDKLWPKMYRGRFANYSTGMNGIGVACWNILGEYLNVPIWQLLGGKQRDQLRVYANGCYQGPREPSFC